MAAITTSITATTPATRSIITTTVITTMAITTTAPQPQRQLWFRQLSIPSRSFGVVYIPVEIDFLSVR